MILGRGYESFHLEEMNLTASASVLLQSLPPVPPFLLEISPLEWPGDVGKYCDTQACLRFWGRLFCLPRRPRAPPFHGWRSPTARIPPLTSAIMRALTGIDLQNDGLTIGRSCSPNFARDKQMGSENRAFEPIRSR